MTLLKQSMIKSQTTLLDIAFYIEEISNSETKRYEEKIKKMLEKHNNNFNFSKHN